MHGHNPKRRVRIPAAKTFISQLGGPSAVAALFDDGITRQSVHRWKRVPPARVQRIARALGIEPSRIRPDVFAAVEV